MNTFTLDKGYGYITLTQSQNKQTNKNASHHHFNHIILKTTLTISFLQLL